MVKTVIRIAPQHGYILLPVVILITLVATTAFLLNNESVLDTGITASKLEVKQAEAVAEAGLNHALWQTAQQGCGPYSDLINQTLGSHRYTTTLTTDLGSTSSYSIAVDQDTWIRSDLPGNNMAADTKLHIRFEGGTIERPMYRYDLSSITSNSNILSATAWFYVSKEHPEGPVDIHLLNTDWTDTDATWDTMGASMDSAIQATIPTQPAAGVWVAVNLTSQVQAWVNGQPNYGITLNSTSEGTHGDYASREASEQPYLEVIVGTPPSSPAQLQAVGKLVNGTGRTINRNEVTLYQAVPGHVQIQPDASNGVDAYIWEWNKTTNYGSDDETWVATGSNNEALALYKFNLGALPPGASILDATLSVYHRTGNDPDVPVTAHRISNAWLEDQVTWNKRDNSTNWDTAGGDYDSTVISTTLVGPANNTRYEWDVTPLVSAWVDRVYENYGVVLRTEQAGIFGERFDTSDHADLSHHPRLTITYRCQCGQVCAAPQGSGNLLFVVSDEWNMTAGEKAKQALFENWGYTVDLISQWDVDWNFDTKAANNDVVYVSEAVDSNTFGMAPKLAASTLGVINEKGGINDELGMASGFTWPVGHSFSIVDNSHYITQPFAAGNLQIFTAAMEGLTVSGSEAGGLETLADWGGLGSLVALETGAALDGGGTAPGRRVMLPLGRDNAFNLDYLNSNGRLIVQRALAWGMHADAVFLGKQLLLVVGNDTGLTSQETAKKALIESWGYTVSLIDEDDDQAAFDAAILANNVVFITEDVNSGDVDTKLVNAATGVVTEEDYLVDEFGFAGDIEWGSTTHLTIDNNSHYITQLFSTGSLQVMTSSESVARLTSPISPDLIQLASLSGDAMLVALNAGAATHNGGTTAGRRVQLPWGGNNFDLDHLNDDGRTIMRRAIEWATEIPVPKAPIARWKLDETTGTTAVDSISGHDGTLSNGPTWTGGQLDGALSFDGTNDYINVAHDDALSLTETMTFSAWINASSFGSSYQTIVAKDGSGSGSNFWFGTWGRELLFGFFSGGTFREVFTSGLDLQPGTWYHLAASFDNNTDEVILYLDGVPVHNGTLTFSPTAVSANLRIGRSPDGEYWRGLLDDVRIYDEVLGDSEIAALALPPEKTPIAHWQLDETSGTIAVDSVGGHDGTLVNGPTWTSGHLAGGLDFDGSNDKIDVGADASLDNLFAGGATLSAWIKPGGWGEGDFGRIADKADNLGSNRNGWAFELHAAQRALMFQYGFSADIGNWYTPVDSISLDSWHHVAVVYDNSASTNDPVIYIDGMAQTLVESDTPAGTPSSDATINLTLGNYALDTSRTFEGVLDDIRIYDLMLDAANIAELAAAGGGGGPPPTGCDGTYRDEFSLQQYDQNDGTLTWAGNWQETGETTDPDGGDISIANDTSNYQLVVRDDGQTIWREADLSTAGSATLSFDYRRQNLNGSGDYVAVEVSYNGGTNWSELARFAGSATDATYTSTSYVLDPNSLSANTRIRLLTPGNGMNNNNKVWFDNIQIQCSP
jgi:hypothetical protein